jgi:hypothetical protein
MGRKLKQSKKKKVIWQSNKAEILKLAGTLSIGGNALEDEKKLYAS